MSLRPQRLAVVVLLFATAATAVATVDWYVAKPNDSLVRAEYVGRKSCIECHQAEAASFAGSDHDRAMEIAGPQTVLGDFDDVTFTRFGDATRFFRDGERYMVNAEGPDGDHHDYEVKYTFGVDPLQQYMVEFPGNRLQVLRVSWDVHKKEWFFVAPDDAADEQLKPDDPLHWTGLAQNWNTMCADCHSTDYHKNYNLAKNEYDPRYKEIDVSCEACHGPGSVHVELAESRSLFWDRNVGYGLVNTLKGADNRAQLETCAPCHSRRVMLDGSWHAGDAFLDHFDPVLLYSGLYHPDGQIRDEVYVYGSFQQSKMFAKGVKCTDCHQPHAGDVKFAGNRLCAQCHQPGKYDTVGHHHHDQAAADAAETQCVTCHMPTRTYMGIDARHDHSLRVPRPDLTLETGAPNACNRCHTKEDEGAAWAAKAIVRWYGPNRSDDPHHGPAIAAAQGNQPGADRLLAEVITRSTTPDIIRATAVELLGAYPSPEGERLRRESLEDAAPLVRAAALRVVTGSSAAKLVLDAAPLLRDPVRAVRFAAATRLVDAVELLKGSAYRDALDEAIAEYRRGQELHLDRAAAHMNLARLAFALDETEKGIESLRAAIRQEPYLTGPRGELAVALEQSGDFDDEVRALRQAEADLLARDATLLPDDPRPRYRRGMLLYLLGDNDGAIDVLTDAVRLDKNDYDCLLALALIFEKEQRWEEALAVLKHMSDLRPDAQDWKGIYIRIRDARATEGSGDAP